MTYGLRTRLMTFVLFSLATLACDASLDLDPDQELVLERWSADLQDREIWIVRVDGTSERPLATSEGADHSPAWSPDGGRIAFASTRDGAGTEIYLMDASGSNVVRLTDDSVRSNWGPAWSPDGSRIAFVKEGVSPNIYVVSAAGGDPRPITAGPGYEAFPAWSPDGARLAFARQYGAPWELFAIDSNGTGEQNLTNTPEQDEYRPAWSPLGNWIAFSPGVSLINPDGSGRRALPLPPASCPDWSPDGLWIAFAGPNPSGAGDINARFEIYVARVDGSSLRRVTFNAVLDDCPKWRPR